jgi:TonB-linked SusC/RagA family outer membrane protein
MRRSLLIAWIICLLSVPMLVLSQLRQVSGRITDDKGDPVPGATITVKGSSTAVSADEAGRFTIPVSQDATLVISASGFAIREIKVGSSTNYNAQLSPAGNLSEVVVTALGIRKEKRVLGYSAQEVRGDELVTSRQSNVVNALQGKVAGVQINSTGGAPGQGSRIVIRGIKSLDPSRNNQPLFVIDGVLMDNSTVAGATDAASLRGMTNRAADINPDDIETISVLKGGAATALYGQAGSNGVVVITTKSAKAGKMRINFTSTYGIDEVNKFPDVQTSYSQGYLGVYSSTDFFPSWGPPVAEAKAQDPTHPDALFNHYKQGYQQGNQFRSTLNISGGTEKALLNSSVSYFKQNGTIPNSDYKNISFRLNGQFKFSDKLKVSPAVYFINSGGLRVNADRYNENLSYWSPRWDVKDYIKPDGTMKSYGNNNPIYGTYSNRFKDDVYRMIGNIAVTYSPLTWLDVDYRLGVDYYSDFRRHTGPGPKGYADEIPFEDNGLGFVDEYRISNRLINSNLIATLKKSWTSKFNSTLRVGTETRDLFNNSLTANGSELDVPDLLSLNNAKVRTNSQFITQYRIVSAYGDLMLGWDNFLFLDVTGRKDWTSTLEAPNNAFFYPSASLSYVFTDNLTLPRWLSYGKLRVSLAEVGKDTDPYRTNIYYNSQPISSTGQIMWSRSDSKGDASLKPERTSTFEVGTELRFLDNRLGVDFTWYKLNSRDQIIPVRVSPTSGFSEVVINAGEIENKGIEIVLNANPVRTNDFRWDVTLNYSRNRNMVVSLREGLDEIVVGDHFGYSGSTATMKYVPGYAVGNIYGTSYQRYYGGKPDDEMTLAKGLPIVINSTGSNAGFPTRDLTQRILGNSQPKWIAGIINSFSYKNFSLSFQFDGQQGQYRYNQLGNFMAAFGIAKYTEDRNTSKVFQGVLADGSANTQMVFLGQGVGPDGRNYGNGWYRNVYRGITENFVEDASWMRLRNLSITYDLPVSVLKKSVVKGASFTLTGNNLWLITDYSGFDPETSSNSAGSNIDAFTGFTYPSVRSFLFTVSLNF